MTVSTDEALAKSDAFPLSEKNISEHVRAAQYAVRGEIVIRAGELEEELKKGKKLPYGDSILYCNIGNPQQLGQVPITFFRQVLALCDYPEMMANPHADKIFPKDVLKRAKEYLAAIPGGTGAYTSSQGAPICREHVAAGITHRDNGIKSDPGNIFMSDGASQSVHTILRMLLRGTQDAVLTPIPQYPLYSAALALYNGTLLPYYLDEQNQWALRLDECKSQVDKARSEGKNVRALIVINPGNPTGSVLSEDNQKEIVKFCVRESLVLLADEVYQDNIYIAGKTFHSFKRVAVELGKEAEQLVLVSMHSISKGFYGECGRRGGYMEIINLPADVKAQLIKLSSINLCSNVNGQICTAMMMNPPKEGEESYELFAKERQGLLDSLKRRAKLLVSALNKLEGVTCNEAEGALYAMPQLKLPPGATKAAEESGKPVDFFYCKELLESTGIVTVPGSGFKQAENTFHFRTTILPPEDQIEEVTERLSKFHAEFMKKYSSS